MAENKKSVLLYCDIIHTVEELNDEEAGKLFKHYLRYINDLEPEPPNKLTQIVFEPIKQNLKRDLKKWESIVSKRSNAGLASANKRQQIQQVSTCVESVEQIQQVSTVTVKDKVKDTVTVKDIKSKEESLPAPSELLKSNLFRQPNIPSREKVYEVFKTNGGTKEMADKFWDNNEATGWYVRGSPITNFVNLIPSFISNWKNFDKTTPKEQVNSMPYNRKITSEYLKKYDV
jgi:hypothetical protein